MISYSQKTWKLDSKEPMHAESGYWRPKPDGTIEVVIAQSTGLVEVQVNHLYLSFLCGLPLHSNSSAGREILLNIDVFVFFDFDLEK